MIRDLCLDARRDLALLGQTSGPVVDALDALARGLGDRSRDAVADPAFALEVLCIVPDASLAGRLLDFLNARSASGVRAGPRVTLAAAVAEYEEGALSLMALPSQRTYRTWTRRLVAAHGERAPAELTSGDLRDLVARHVAANQAGRAHRAPGSCGERNAVAAYRHLWAYLVQKRYAAANVAMELRKPADPQSTRRAFKHDEAALVRSLAAAGREPMLDQLVVLSAERAVLRNVEICRLRVCDVDLVEDVYRVWGKGDKHRVVPLTPGLRAFLVAYIEDRRPHGVPPEQWLASTEPLMRYRPSARYPRGKACGRRYIERLLERLRGLAPALFANGDVCIHSYRHMAGKWIEMRFGRAYKRAALGHTSRASATDDYGKVDVDELRAALTEYEDWLTGPA